MSWFATALRNAERPTPERDRWYHRRDWVSRYAPESAALAGMAVFTARTKRPATGAEVSELVKLARAEHRRFQREVATYGSSAALTCSYQLMALAREYHGTRVGPGALPEQP